MVIELAVLAAAYLLGAIPFALVIGIVVKDVDIRQHGSGNVGTTNAFRTLGGRVGAAVLVADIFKGGLSAALGLWAGGPPWGILAAVAAVIGHVFPVYIRFKGGKGIATGAGAFAVLFPGAFLVGILCFLATFFLTHYVSLASLVGALTLGVAAVILGYELFQLGAIWLVVVFVVFTHRDNIGRLVRGNERKVYLSGGKDKGR